MGLTEAWVGLGEVFGCADAVFVAVGVPVAALIDEHGEVLAVGIDDVAAGVEGFSVSVARDVFGEDVVGGESLPVLYECAAVFV